MAFTVTGTIRGKAAQLTWDDGKLSGDRRAVSEASIQAAARDGYPVGPTCGPFTERDHLKDPLSSVCIFLLAFDKGAVFSGDLPEIPPLPDGAIP